VIEIEGVDVAEVLKHAQKLAGVAINIGIGKLKASKTGDVAHIVGRKGL
jgi:hypothetical protein